MMPQPGEADPLPFAATLRQMREALASLDQHQLWEPAIHLQWALDLTEAHVQQTFPQ
jgi:hypothetical protein